jgi:hypothetical protein
MAGLTLTTADAVLKEDYLPGVREQLNQEGFISTIEKNDTDIIEGRRAVLAIHTRRTSGVGARSEGGALPAAGNQGYTDEYIPLRYNYAVIQVSGQTIRAMKSNKGSFVRAIDSEMNGAVNDTKRDVSRQAWGTSNGVIGQCGTTTASATVVMSNATAVQMRQFEEGMVVDIGTVASPFTVVQAAVIQPGGVDLVNKTITIGSSVTTSSSHFVFRSGSGGAGASQQELTGLQTIVSNTGALFNIDPATYGVWKSYVDSNGGTLRSANEMMFAKAQQQIRIAGGSDIEIWIASDGVHRSYAALLTGQKRFPGTVQLKGGYEGIAAAASGTSEVPVTWDRDAPSNSAFGLRLKNLTEYQASDWEWANEDGAILQRQIGFDGYNAFLFKYAELATDKRNAHGKIVDLTEA